MLFYLIWITLVALVCGSSHGEKSQSWRIGYIDLNVNLNIDNEETNIQSGETSTSISSECKKRSIAVTIMSKVERRKRLKYRGVLDPIRVEIDTTLETSLKDLELQLYAQGSTIIWENPDKLLPTLSELLCTNAWVSLKPLLKFGVELTDNVKPDCGSALVLGPSQENPGRMYIGVFQYLHNFEHDKFYPDMLRCHCAFKIWENRSGKYATNNKTKKFFFLLKVTEKVYYVLTTIGKLNDRKVRIVNVYNHVAE